jgi:hypothetical protein
VRPQEQEVKDQPSSSTTVNPPTQYEEHVPQGDGMDQGGPQEQERMNEEEAPHASPTQIRTNIQRDHLVDQIHGDNSKGVTTRSCVEIFVSTTLLFILLSLSR